MEGEMTMRLQEIHPALVHAPIVLLPVSIVADTLGTVGGSPTLREVGRRTMPLAAASSLLAGLAGFVAQEAVSTDAEARDLLITHRTLNLGVVTLSFLLARARTLMEKASPAYLLAGMAGLGVMTYSAYLGGKMVYQHGVGVASSGGIDADRASEISLDSVPEVARDVAYHLFDGVRHAAVDAVHGRLFPAIAIPGEKPVHPDRDLPVPAEELPPPLLPQDSMAW
jgi:uncharacterized membrane protein